MLRVGTPCPITQMRRGCSGSGMAYVNAKLSMIEANSGPRTTPMCTRNRDLGTIAPDNPAPAMWGKPPSGYPCAPAHLCARDNNGLQEGAEKGKKIKEEMTK